MPVIPAEQYSAIRSQLNTGDLLAFDGTNPLDFMINLFEEGSYSHVGMVLKDASGNLWFWDAPGGGNTFPDPYWKGPGPNPGCRVADLDVLLAYYMQYMGLKTFTWRQLTPSIPYGPGSALVDFITANDGTPFPGTNCQLPPGVLALLQKCLGSNFQQDLQGVELGLGLLLSYLPGAVLLVPTAGYFYCAQLVAATYMVAGLLPSPAPPPCTNLPPNGYTPANFLDQPHPLVLQNGASLSVPITVEWDGTTTLDAVLAQTTSTRVAAMALNLEVSAQQT